MGIEPSRTEHSETTDLVRIQTIATTTGIYKHEHTTFAPCNGSTEAIDACLDALFNSDDEPSTLADELSLYERAAHLELKKNGLLWSDRHSFSREELLQIANDPVRRDAVSQAVRVYEDAIKRGPQSLRVADWLLLSIRDVRQALILEKPLDPQLLLQIGRRAEMLGVMQFEPAALYGLGELGCFRGSYFVATLSQKRIVEFMETRDTASLQDFSKAVWGRRDTSIGTIDKALSELGSRLERSHPKTRLHFHRRGDVIRVE